MINIFRSKDILKNTNEEFKPRLDHPLISTSPRGVYVAGEHRPVFFADHMLTVEDVSSEQADVHVYTTKYESLEPDDYIQFLGFDIDNDNDFTITDFHSRETTTEPDDWLVFLGFDFEANDIKVDDFFQANVSTEPDDWLVFLGFDFTMTDFIIGDIYRIGTQQTDCMIRITSVGGTKATISH